MAQIVSKLNLNKTPVLVENNSLVFAKNIRVDIDGSIHRDYSITNIFKDKNLLEQLEVDFNKEDNVYKYYYNIINDATSYEIIDIISDSTDFYILLYIIKTEVKTETDTETGSEVKTEIQHKQSIIAKYNEDNKTLYPCNCNWNYSDGSITGLVVNNLLNETILIIAESSETDKIPLKCINLDKSKYTDDETIYTQTPNIPFINLDYISYYDFSIPNGVYQFFIRYKIRYNFYTNWFPASRELFAGNNTKTSTIYGTISYHNDVINSDNSFVFNVDTLFKEYITNFESFQIGFIVSNKQTSKARAWKHFSFDTKTIYFDYKSEDAEEINIEDFTNSIFGIYNVKNISFFKNKLYISNYEEFNYNNNDNNSANINVSIKSNNKTVSFCLYDSARCKTDDNKNITKIKRNDDYISINDILKEKFVTILCDTINNLENKTYSNYNEYINELDIKVNVAIDKIENNKTCKKIRLQNENNTITPIESIALFVSNLFEFLNIYGVNINANVISGGTPTNIGWKTDKTISEYEEINSFYIDLLDENNEYCATIEFEFKFNKNKIQYYNIDNIKSSTLIPYQSYNIYVHYVKQTGETTNGYLVKTVDVSYANITNYNEPISLEFKNITIPKGYSCCFFSIVLIKNKVSTVVVEKSNKNNYEGYCIELNNRLFSFTNKLNLQWDAKTNNSSVYYDSNDDTYCRYFGAQGLINLGYDYHPNKVFLVNNYENDDDTNYQLIKCTPYITSNQYDDVANLNLLGFVCEIYPLNTNKTTTLYNDGTAIYSKNDTLSDINSLQLVEYNKYKETDENYNTNWYNNITLLNTKSTYIYSNFNFNYLELSDDLKIKYITYYYKSEYDNSTKTSSQKMFKLQPSLNLSSMYTLDSTYYNYTRKTYVVYNSHDVYKFNNTIRCSTLATDEENINVFTFDANHYYNIPTDKGIITNIKTLGDILLIHTRDSMFKFTGHNTLQSNNGDVQQTESDIFNTGAEEIFSSDFGYAGLYDKKDSITTMIGYIFYDKNANIIYAYSGNGQLVKLSDSIEKLFRYDTITNVSFANDYYNNRFFVCLHYSNNKTLTLSYCFNEESKSFVSIHDFAFENAFNTRTKCYFITKDKKQISSIDKSSFGLYPKFNTTNSIYPSFILEDDGDNSKYASIIDIIENSNYENVKTLNFVSWNNAIVENEFPIYENTDEPFNALESKNKQYPCRSIMLYTDTCSTGNISCFDISNNKKIDKTQYYKLPRYNQGLWTLNYFRNILNSNDNTETYSGDNNSLIEGKYFVARFILDEDFKFETINFNYNGKL